MSLANRNADLVAQEFQDQQENVYLPLAHSAASLKADTSQESTKLGGLLSRFVLKRDKGRRVGKVAYKRVCVCVCIMYAGVCRRAGIRDRPPKKVVSIFRVAPSQA